MKNKLNTGFRIARGHMKSNWKISRGRRPLLNPKNALFMIQKVLENAGHVEFLGTGIPKNK